VNEEYLESARARVADPCVLINAAAKRAAELARGARPLVPVMPQDERSSLDLALLEIAEGKIEIMLGISAQATETTEETTDET